MCRNVQRELTHIRVETIACKASLQWGALALVECWSQITSGVPPVHEIEGMDQSPSNTCAQEQDRQRMAVAESTAGRPNPLGLSDGHPRSILVSPNVAGNHVASGADNPSNLLRRSPDRVKSRKLFLDPRL